MAAFQGFSPPAFLAALGAGLQQSRDLTSNAEAAKILELATVVVDSAHVAEISAYANEHPELPASVLAAVKNAASFHALQQVPAPFHLTVLFPMYHEQNRARPKSEHPNGQDLVRNKVLQLEWLFGASAGSSWDLVACDDGCDQGSSDVVRGIIEQAGLGGKVQVIHLQAAIDGKIPMFAPLRTCKDSRKGGAVLFGLYHTAQRLRADRPHLVIYTDSDLSSDLAMSGLLVSLCLVDGHRIGAGVRYGYPGSFLVKNHGAEGHPESHLRKPDCVHVTVRHFVRGRLLPHIRHLYDTNCGFKCWRVADLKALLPKMTIFGPAFDMQLLLHAVRHYRAAGCGGGTSVIGVAPILFVEDFAESNFTSNSTDPDASAKSFLRMAKEICEMAGEFTPPEDLSEEALELRRVVLGLDLEQYKASVARIESTLGRSLLFDAELPLSVFATRRPSVGG